MQLPFTIYCTYKKQEPGKIINSLFTRSTSSWVYSIAALLGTFWVLNIDVPTTDLLLRKYTQRHLTHFFFTPYDIYDFEKSAALGTPALGTAKKRQEARVAWDAAYCRILCR